ncbi:hypothetical protein Tco_1244114 [Tanacetum coccineum]
MCYNPLHSSTAQTAVDALPRYITLYRSLFAIGNMRLPFNSFCLDVFMFFKCRFSLLNRFGVARLRSIVVARKAHAGEPSLPILDPCVALVQPVIGSLSRPCPAGENRNRTAKCSGGRRLVTDYGIAMCYNPLHSSTAQTAVDALPRYITLYRSLFTIGNMRLPFNSFCLDVFMFFKCRFSLLNPFGVARLRSFVVACKAHAGEPSLPILDPCVALVQPVIGSLSRPCPAGFGGGGTGKMLLQVGFGGGNDSQWRRHSKVKMLTLL